YYNRVLIVVLLAVRCYFFFFFFFQAEDGIRDRNVTGVQTCALPIWSGDHSGRCKPRRDGAGRRPLIHPEWREHQDGRLRAHERRSEERRVGKECRDRRGRDQGEKRRGRKKRERG